MSPQMAPALESTPFGGTAQPLVDELSRLPQLQHFSAIIYSAFNVRDVQTHATSDA